jgi:flagellar protein FlaF
MSISARAAQGYRAVQLQTESPRGTEAKLFAEVTAELVRAERAGALGFKDLAAALHRNRLLWDTLLADLAQEANELPAALKAQLIHLGHFVRQHSGRVLQGEDAVRPLIDINQAILAGLRGLPVEGSPNHVGS